MLRTVMDIPGDSFEERWSNLEGVVRTDCAVVGAPYPETTLGLVQPWFASVGDWFDRWSSEIQGRHPIQAPGTDHPALVILREFDDLLSRYAEFVDEAPDWSDRHGLPGEYAHDVGTLRFADGHVLAALTGPGPGLRDERRNEVPDDMVKDLPEGWTYEEGVLSGPDGNRTDLRPSKVYPTRARQEAVAALTEFLGLTGSAVYGHRWPTVKQAAKQQAERQGKCLEEVVQEEVEKAVCVAFGRFLDENRSVELDLSQLEEREGSYTAAVDLTGILSRNLIPGFTVPDLRSQVNNWTTEGFLGPAWRLKTESRPQRASEEALDERTARRVSLRRWVESEKDPDDLLERLARVLTDEERTLFSRLRENGGNVTGAARKLCPEFCGIELRRGARAAG
jgi:hypothetical protein